MRRDHQIILEMVRPGSKVLDLGCGDGELLFLLKEKKSCRGVGIEINEQAIYGCMEKGVSVAQGDIDSGLQDYSDQRFDYVILNDSLQEILNPEKVIQEALRVGRRVIVGIPNFCNFSARLQIVFKGQVPVTKWLPYKWYNTPNLRFLSLKDFELFCRDKNILIEQRRALTHHREIRRMTNLLAYMGIYLLKKGA